MAIEKQPELRPLTRLETAFVEHYISTWNAALSYRLAGGKGKSSRVYGYKIMIRPPVQAKIEARLRELSMQANEALERLAEQARLNPSEFFFFEEKDVKNPVTGKIERVLVKAGINWQAVRDRGHLIKGIEYDRHGNTVLKFHDSQRALELIGKNLKLFSEVIDLNNLGVLVKAYVGISPDDWDQPPADTEHESEP